MSHCRTEKPVVDRDRSHEPGHEIQRQNSENKQIKTLQNLGDHVANGLLPPCRPLLRLRGELQQFHDALALMGLLGA